MGFLDLRFVKSYGLLIYVFLFHLLVSCNSESNYIENQHLGECYQKNIYQLINNIESLERVKPLNKRETISFIISDSFGPVYYHGLSKERNKFKYREAFLYSCDKDSSQIEISNFCHGDNINYCVKSLESKSLSRADWNKTLKKIKKGNLKNYKFDTSCLQLDGAGYFLNISTNKLKTLKIGSTCGRNRELLDYGDFIMKYSDF